MISAVVAGVDEVSERVMALVAAETGRARAVLTPETEIERDLGCSPKEARDLLARLESEFGIDMSGMDFDRHFDRAGSLFWPFGVALVVSLPLAVLGTLVLGPILQAFGVPGPRAVGTGGLFTTIYLACVLAIGFTTGILPMLRARRVEKIPVTVQTLIEAALLRKWPQASAEGVLK